MQLMYILNFEDKKFRGLPKIRKHSKLFLPREVLAIPYHFIMLSEFCGLVVTRKPL